MPQHALCPASGAASYTAVVRTYKSFPLVEAVIAALRAQSCPPEQVVVVDSGSPEHEQDQLKQLADVFIRYPDEPFNFSKAINIGVAVVHTTHVLIISSHFMLDGPDVIEHCFAQARDRRLDAFFLTNRCDAPHLQVGVVSRDNFNGANGYSNSCGMLPTAQVKLRPFREDVFACEDQEWARWYLMDLGRSILKVSTPHTRYLNQRVNLTKTLNEELAIACFIDRGRLSLLNILLWALRSGVSMLKQDMPRARFKLQLARELFKARTTPPTKVSRYFAD